MKTIPLSDSLSVKYCNLFAPFDNPLRLIHLYHNNKLSVWLNTNPGIGGNAVYKKSHIDFIYFNRGYFITVLNFPRSVIL